VAETFPRRDEDGRVISVRELLVATALGTAVGMIALLVIDGALALLSLGDFGQASGWLAMILPGLLFFDDLRGWRGHGIRFLVALVAAGVGIGLGLIAAAVLADADRHIPPLVTGGVGALIAGLVYAFVWFVGVRWLTGERGRA
jgi:hypothetical protein